MSIAEFVKNLFNTVLTKIYMKFNKMKCKEIVLRFSVEIATMNSRFSQKKVIIYNKNLLLFFFTFGTNIY